MDVQRRTGRRPLALIVTVALVLLLGAGTTGSPAAGSRSPGADAEEARSPTGGSPRVLPPHSEAFGKTYGEWSAEWWKWALALPAQDDHPLIADGDVDCTLGQRGKVWFLGGTYAPGPDPNNPSVTLGTADRTCEVPTGKALYFPIINIICSPVTGDGRTTAQLTACATTLLDDFVRTDTLTAAVDGRGIDDLARYRTVSGRFFIDPLPDPNLLGAPQCFAASGCPPARLGPTRGPAVTSGYYVLLAPLSEGEHTVTFAGRLVVPGVFEFALDIRYALTVVGGR